MADPVPERHARCRRLVWQMAHHVDGITPGPYCQNSLGVFPLIDCPEFQGRSCLHFEERPEDPAAATGEEIRELSVELSRDYLTWRYWRRVAGLTSPTEAPPPPDPE